MRTAEENSLVLRLKGYLGVDLDDKEIQQRAWRRIRVFNEIAAECDADRPHGGDWIRHICHKATAAEPDLVSLAILAGPSAGEDDV